jgi:hypothetical protein
MITQPDHARIAGELLSLWRADGVPDLPRREDLLFAAREHDNGWQEADAAPRIDPHSSKPYGFRDLPDPLRLEIWQRGVERNVDDQPYAALLIAAHADHLHRDRRGAASWQPFFTRLDELTEELLQRTGTAPAELEADYQWLRLVDSLSLVACGDSPELAIDRWSAHREPDRVRLQPFPFAGATTFSIPCRHIPDRPYESDTDLTVELATAHWTQVKVRLTPD